MCVRTHPGSNYGILRQGGSGKCVCTHPGMILDRHNYCGSFDSSLDMLQRYRITLICMYTAVTQRVNVWKIKPLKVEIQVTIMLISTHSF